MEKINEALFKKYKERQEVPHGKKSPRSERELIVTEVVEKLNKERVGSKFRPTGYMAVFMKVRHLSDFDLKWHVRECEKTSNFSKCFFGRLKTKYAKVCKTKTNN